MSVQSLSERAIQKTALKAAIYIRVSTHWQVDKDSLQVQRRELLAYCEMVLGITDCVVFEDPGYSAKNTDRPDYQKMMSRLRTGEFSHLVVWKIDRISRNLMDFTEMYAELKKLGITFVSKNEQFDTSSAIGEAMLKIILVFAELERNMTSERVTAVMLSRANNGQWNGGHVPYGYAWDKETKSFSFVPEEVAIIKKIWDLYEDRQSIAVVCSYLNGHGIKTRRGNEWSYAGLHTILSNPFYCGAYRYNVTKEGTGYKRKDESEWILIENHHEPIFSKERFDRVQAMKSRNRRNGFKPGDSYTRKNVHVFSGILRCGICGSNMSATISKARVSGWRPSVYGCSHRRHNPQDCSNKYVTDAVIGPFVFNYIANMIRAKDRVAEGVAPSTAKRLLLKGKEFSSVTDIDGIVEWMEVIRSGQSGVEYHPPVVQDVEDQTEVERLALDDRKRKAEIALTRLQSLYLYGNGELSEKDYILKRKELRDTIEEVNNRLEQINTSTDILVNDDEFVEKASYFLMVEKLLDGKHIDYQSYIRGVDPNIPRSFIRSIIDHIEIIDGNVTSILFRNGMKHIFHYNA